MDLSLSYCKGAPPCKHPCIPAFDHTRHLQQIEAFLLIRALSFLNPRTEQYNRLGCAHAVVLACAPADEMPQCMMWCLGMQTAMTARTARHISRW
jgi:hypothetical protein